MCRVMACVSWRVHSTSLLEMVENTGPKNHFVQVGPGDEPDPSYGQTDRQEDDQSGRERFRGCGVFLLLVHRSQPNAIQLHWKDVEQWRPLWIG